MLGGSFGFDSRRLTLDIGHFLFFLAAGLQILSSPCRFSLGLL
jgi:hypothetical protein